MMIYVKKTCIWRWTRLFNAGPFPLLFVRGSDDSCVKTNEFEPFIDEIAEETWFLKEYVITIPGGDRELRVEK